jgi:hypothetical protein
LRGRSKNKAILKKLTYTETGTILLLVI